MSGFCCRSKSCQGKRPGPSRGKFPYKSKLADYPCTTNFKISYYKNC